jgi:hypothetical protein
MALPKLIIPPDQGGYNVSDGNEVISTKLDGGSSRMRRDIVGNAYKVAVSWSLNPNDYRYVKGFHNITVNKGADAFLMDLYVDRENLTEHECRFIPSTFKLARQRGNMFVVTAQLEVTPVTLSQSEQTSEKNWVEQYAIEKVYTQLTVSGAGTAGANGDYVLSGFDANEYARYVKGDYIVYCDTTVENKFFIYDDNIIAPLALYENTDISSLKPPETNWQVTLGNAPAPTITY